MTGFAMAAVLLQSSAELRAGDGLTAFSWTFMLVCMGAVTLLTAWSFNRILRGKEHFDPDGTGPAHAPVPGEVERARR
jgi:hypothetical protein